jgi:hypothetical protein
MVKVLVIDKVFSMFLESAEKQEGGGAHGVLASGGLGIKKKSLSRCCSRNNINM